MVRPAQDVAIKLTIISPEAARRRSLCDRLEAAFMQEIALLKASPADSHVLRQYVSCLGMAVSTGILS